jgi:hypothetical protein
MIDWMNRPHDHREDLEMLVEEYEYASSLSEDDFYNEYKEEEDMNEYLEFVNNEIKDVRNRIEEEELQDEYEDNNYFFTHGAFANEEQMRRFFL